MATTQQVNTAQKYMDMIQSIVSTLRSYGASVVWYQSVPFAERVAPIRTSITQINNFWNGLAPAAQTSLNTLIGNLGYTSSEFDTARSSLVGQIGTDLDAVATALTNVKASGVFDGTKYNALVTAINTLVTDVNAIALTNSPSF